MQVHDFFYLHNIITEEETDFLINNSLSISPPYGFLRSNTGIESRGTIASDRTSENAWDVNSSVAMSIMKRIFGITNVLYKKNQADGLQIVRYQKKQAYWLHNDFYPIGSVGTHNLDPNSGGTNRYATVFIYLNNVEEGGQTFFPRADVLSEKILDQLDPNVTSVLSSHKQPANIISKFSKLFKTGSWEKKMIKKCHNFLSIKPKKAKAILFYNLTPKWKIDPMSLHGGCPVVAGTKWGANAWVWNGPMPVLKKNVKTKKKKKSKRKKHQDL